MSEMRLGATTLRAIWQEAWRPSRWNVACWFIWAAALAGELALVVILQDGQIYGWEQSLARWIQSLGDPGLWFKVSGVLTNTIALEFIPLFLAFFLLLVAVRHYTAAAVLFLSLPLHVLANFPKQLVDRQRPSDLFEGITGIGGSRSFPSGHAEFVVTFYGFLTYLLVIHLDRPWQRVIAVVAWLVLVVITGYGRVSAGRHWPLDVLYSYVIGLAVLSGLIWLYRAVRRAQERAPRQEQAGPAQRCTKESLVLFPRFRRGS